MPMLQAPEDGASASTAAVGHQQKAIEKKRRRKITDDTLAGRKACLLGSRPYGSNALPFHRGCPESERWVHPEARHRARCLPRSRLLQPPRLAGRCWHRSSSTSSSSPQTILSPSCPLQLCSRTRQTALRHLVHIPCHAESSTTASSASTIQ